MVALAKGLKAIKQQQDEAAARRAAQENKAAWFKLQDGESVKVRFPQELDEDAPGYSEKRGIGFLAVEHVSPIAVKRKDYSRKALCSLDEQGRCVGCEEHRKDPKAGWGQKRRLYINVLVAKADGTWEPMILSQGTSGKSITPTLLEYAFESGTITNRAWKIVRNGAGLSDTSYTLIAFDKDEKPFDYDAYDIVDLDKVVRMVPYEEQAEFYLLDDGDSSSSPEEAVLADSLKW